MSKAQQTKLLKDLVRIKGGLDAAKELYREYDKILNTLVEKQPVTKEFRLGQNVIQIVDNFEKNTAWKSTAFRRFDIKVNGK